MTTPYNTFPNVRPVATFHFDELFGREPGKKSCNSSNKYIPSEHSFQQCIFVISKKKIFTNAQYRTWKYTLIFVFLPHRSRLSVDPLRRLDRMFGDLRRRSPNPTKVGQHSGPERRKTLCWQRNGDPDL